MAASTDQPRAHRRAIGPAIRRHPIRTWHAFIGTLALLFVLGGVTTSSLSSDTLRVDFDHAPTGLVAGGPDASRTDEFLRTTPWALGIAARGDDSFRTPLGQDQVALATRGTGGPVTTVLYPETGALRLGGRALRAQTFAFAWWLPTVLVLLLLPVWFRQLGAGPSIGIPLTVIVFAAPVSIWWSWGVLNVLGWAVAGSVAAYAAVAALRAGRRWWYVALLTLAAVLSFARLGLAYQPWSIPLAVACVLPTLVAVMSIRVRRGRATLLAVAIAGAAGALLVGFLLENRAALDVISETVYPGTRRFAGALVDIGQLFSAPHLWTLQTNPALVGTNSSEIATAFTVLALAALVLVPSIDWRNQTVERRALIASFVAFAVIGSWCLVAWPTWAERVFPFNVVAPTRIAQIIGIPATLLFGLALAARRSAPLGGSRPVAASVGAIVLVASLAGGSALRQGPIPSFATEWIALGSIGAAMLVAVAVLRAERTWALVPLAAVAFLATATVNPIQVGLGDLGSGPAAAAVRVGDDQDVWASDDLATDALLMASGDTSLSGQLWVGPNEDAWHVLDPKDRARDTWNRAASFVAFGWGLPGTGTKIDLASLDAVRVIADPCDEKLTELDLRWIVSGVELEEARCLTLHDEFEFGGKHRYLYERRA